MTHDDDTALVADRLTGTPVFHAGRDRASWFEPEARILRGPAGSFVWPPRLAEACRGAAGRFPSLLSEARDTLEASAALRQAGGGHRPRPVAMSSAWPAIVVPAAALVCDPAVAGRLNNMWAFKGTVPLDTLTSVSAVMGMPIEVPLATAVGAVARWPALAVWLAVQSGPRGVPAECEWLFAPFAGDGGEARLRLRLLKDLVFKGDGR
jgi:hypothetical protein